MHLTPSIKRRLKRARLSITFLLGLVLTVLPTVLHGQEAHITIQPVADGIYAVKRAYVGSNAAFILTEDGVVVVDSHASPAAARDTLRAIRRVTGKPVRYVINTHWHTDHMAGNRAYLNAYGEGVEFISHHTAREDMQNLSPRQLPVTIEFLARDVERAEQRLAAEPNEHDRSLTDAQKDHLRRFIADQKDTLDQMREMQFVLPTMTFERSLVLHAAGRPIHILYFGKGHTRGDVVVYLPKEKVIVSGDLLTTPQLYVGGSSYPAQWAASLKTLAQLDFEHIIPGHGDIDQGKDYLLLVTAMLDSIVEQVREAVGQGLKLEDVRQQVSLAELRDSLTTGDPKKEEMVDRAAKFLEDAVGRAYLEATGKLPD